MCLVVTCWERTVLLALVCGDQLWVCHFPSGILGQVWYLIVLIPDLSTLTYFHYINSCHAPQLFIQVYIQTITCDIAYIVLCARRN